MKIAWFCDYYPPNSVGGASISAHQVLRELTLAGVECHVFTRPRSGPMTYEGVKIHHLHSLKKWTLYNNKKVGGVPSFLGMAKYVINKEDFSILKEMDIIHASERDVSILTQKLAEKYKIPAIQHIRDYFPICPYRSLYRYYENGCKIHFSCVFCQYENSEWYYGRKDPIMLGWAIVSKINQLQLMSNVKKFNYIVSISNFVSKILKEFLDLSSEIIFNPISFDIIEESLRKEKMKDNDVPQIIYVGKLSKEKGFFDFLIACNKLFKRGRKIRLTIIGEGPLSELTTTMQNKYKDIDFLCQKSWKETIERIKRADICVIPPRWPEPFGRVALESLALGTPVLATNVGGLPEIIKEGGILINLSDLKHLDKVILKCIKEGIDMDVKALKRHLNKFTGTRIAQKHIKLYRKIHDGHD